MKSGLSTLILFLSLFAVSANKARACGGDHTDRAAISKLEAVKKSCCSTETETASANPFKPDTPSDCPCDHDNGACHCPGCGRVSTSGAAFTLEIPPSIAASPLTSSGQKLAFYFDGQLPESVYLSIWQPPKLGA